ncbi:MAG: recombinase family protein [Planctomycetales bacterium]|nr:recombinase family protein [Planctomycetales bacterium]
MIAFLNPPLAPRDGRTLRIVIACRVSDPRPGKQDERSLGDQEAEHRRWIEEHTDLPYEVEVVAGSGSGESLEREEFSQLNDLVASGNYDLVLTEDLGRIARRVHAHLFGEHCVDHDVRLIALNDGVDTATSGWQDRSIFSSWHHERSNRDTSDRIKRTHRNRFNHGGALALPIFGYRKPLGAKGDEDLEKDPACEAILKEWFRKLDEDDASYSEIADWLNEQGAPTGPYCRQEKWTCQMVTRITHNWLLKGVRFRNKRQTRRNNKTGKYRSEKAAPEDLLTRPVPHLAYFDEAYYDHVVAKLDQRNRKFRRAEDPRDDPLYLQPKKRTRFPGQSIRCGICGRAYVFGGHGQRDHLMCSGAREYKCWNAFTVDENLARERFGCAIFRVIESLPAFEPEFQDMMQEEFANNQAQRSSKLEEIDAELAKIARGTNNIISVLREVGTSMALRTELQRLERRNAELQWQRNQIISAPRPTIRLPSMDEVKELARREFTRLSRDSHQFSQLLRELLPSILVFPIRLCDGGAIYLRSVATFSATSLVPRTDLEVVKQRLSTTFSVDLFVPPQRELYREQVVQMRGQGISERRVAERLRITTTAAQRAASLQREMDRRGIDSPWLPVVAPPNDMLKLRRHLHARYVFSPLQGFPHRLPV